MTARNFGDVAGPARDEFVEVRAFLGRNPTCTRCRRGKAAIVRGGRGGRVALCKGCAERGDGGIAPARGEKGRGRSSAARRAQNRMEAALPRYAVDGRSSNIGDQELAEILAKITEKIGSDSAKMYQLMAEAGMNADDFKYMVEQIGISIDDAEADD